MPEVATPAVSVPPLTVVAPVYVLRPESVWVPVLNVTPPATPLLKPPSAKTPEKFALLGLVIIKVLLPKLTDPAPVKETMELLVVTPEISKIPVVITDVEYAILPEPVMASVVPLPIVVEPVYVFTPLIV